MRHALFFGLSLPQAAAASASAKYGEGVAAAKQDSEVVSRIE
jgi:hypothetical protein